MKAIKFIFAILIFAAVLPLSAQQQQKAKTKASADAVQTTKKTLITPGKPDPVTVSKIDFKKIQSNDIFSSEGQWTRIAVELNIIGNPDESANNQNWVRNIDVAVTLLYKDEKAKSKSNPENMIALKAKARLFAGKVSTKPVVVFYIPAEAYFVYRLSPEAFAWSIDVGVNGEAIPLSKENYKNRLSRIIAKSGKIDQILASFNKLVDKASSTNEGVLLPLPKCPFNVQWYEYNKNSSNNGKVPTYITEGIDK